MRILYVITRGDTIAGAQRNVLDLATAFAAEHTVVVASSGADGPFAAELARRGIEFRPIESLRPGAGPRAQLRAVTDLDRLIREFRPDLIHAHSTKAGLLGRLAARRRGVPSVFTAHGWAFTTGIPPVRRFLGLTMEYLARPLHAHVITVSEHDLALGRKARTVAADHLHLVEYGIPDLDDEPEPPPTGREPLLLMAARFEPQKDHLTLIRALARLTDLQWHVVLAGDGPLLGDMESEADELGLGDRIDFLGYEPDVPAVLRRSSAVLLITNYEGLPISIMEALRAARPVVATDVGGIAQMVVPGSTGLLTAPNDVESVESALRTALTTPGWFEQSGRAARSLYLEHFTQARMVDRTRQVYSAATGAARC